LGFSLAHTQLKENDEVTQFIPSRAQAYFKRQTFLQTPTFFEIPNLWLALILMRLHNPNLTANIPSTLVSFPMNSSSVFSHVILPIEGHGA
jgi:hypothetical protein